MLSEIALKKESLQMAAQFIFKRIALPNPKDLESSGLQRTVGPVSLVFNGIAPALFCFISYSVFEVEHVTGPSACLGFIVGGLLSVFYGESYIVVANQFLIRSARKFSIIQYSTVVFPI